ncbi:MAG: polysaccharide deacetylase family protein [Nitriliruptorales bacterium]
MTRSPFWGSFAATASSNRTMLDLGIAVFGLPLGSLVNVIRRWSRDRVGVAVVFHRIGDPQGNPAKEFVPARGTRLFESQLRHLKRGYRLVKASELLDACQTRRLGQRIPLAITFDDDLPSHAAVALPILEKAGIPATFFLCGASLDGPFAFWWERLQVALDQGTLEDVAPRLATAVSTADSEGFGIIYRLLSAVEAMTPDEREQLSEHLRCQIALAPDTACMGADDVRAIADAGHEIGFHTRRHEPLPTLADNLLSAAVTHGKSELEEIAGQRITAIAYPQGKADSRTARVARSAGYRFGYMGSGRPVDQDSDPLLLGRIEPSFKSAGHLSLRLAQMLLSSRRGDDGDTPPGARATCEQFTALPTSALSDRR